MGDSTPRTSAVTANMARALKNSLLWNYSVHVRNIFTDITFPASDAGRDAWSEFYKMFASYLDENIGAESVSDTLDYCTKTKKRGSVDKALAKLGRNNGAPTPTVKAAASASADPKAIAARRFAAGEIGITDFTAIIEALNAAQVGDNIPSGSAKVTAEETEEPTPLPEPVVIPIQYDPEDDDDLPF